MQWLENDFFSYLSDWEKSVNERSGFTKTAMNSMLLSRETILGLKMTSKCVLYTLPKMICLVLPIQLNRLGSLFATYLKCLV